jgi:hypothetical protein
MTVFGDSESIINASGPGCGSVARRLAPNDNRIRLLGPMGFI